MTTVPHDKTKDAESAPTPAERTALPAIGSRLEADGVWAEVYAHAGLPTKFGDFSIVVFRTSEDEKEHVAVIRGVVAGAENVLSRVHSECLTGDVLGSLRCDCRNQLESALRTMGKAEQTVLLYLRQEGRGIGLGNKVRAYALQEQGLDTYEANQHLGFDDDLRDYRAAALMLRLLGVKSVQLATNNPRKVFGLKSNGVDVSLRVPLLTEHNPHNVRYLDTKREKSGHILPVFEA